MTTHESITILPLMEDQTRSLAKIFLDGVNAAVRNRECRITYEVVCGEGVMSIEGELHELRPGVCITVEPGKAYQDMGKLSMLATSEPPFRADQVEMAEPQLPLAFGDEIHHAFQATEVVV